MAGNAVDEAAGSDLDSLSSTSTVAAASDTFKVEDDRILENPGFDEGERRHGREGFARVRG